MNIDNIEPNIDTNVIDSYINFVNTTNSSLHSMIEIINNQQSSFNQILSNHMPPRNIPSIHIERPIQSRYFPSNNNYVNRNNRNSSFLRHYFQNRTLPTHQIRASPNLNSIVNNILYNSFDEPNSNIPTENEIIRATEICTFQDISSPINHSCPICQIDFSDNDVVMMIKECRHIFSHTSIMSWFRRNVHCPLCRFDIRTYGISGEHIEEQNSPSSNPLPFAQQLASMISDQLTNDNDFSGNINIELTVPPRNS
jgi:hypothetical protein